MIFTDFYRFKKISDKSKMRLDLIASTGTYDYFENLKGRDGKPFLYCGINTHTQPGKDGKSDLALTHTRHISSIYTPDVNVPFGIGDISADALVIDISNLNIVDGHPSQNDTIDIYVARGYSRQKNALWQSVEAGEFTDEMEALRLSATEK